MRFLARSILISVVAATILSTDLSAQEKPDAPRRGKWAVLVGVDNYVQAEKLRYCGADQIALRDRLVAAGFPAEQVFLLHDKADSKYLPFKVNIEQQLRLVLDLIEEDDLVIVGFSGHGAHLDGKSYFCPTDAVLDNPATLVSLDAVYKQFENSPAALKLLLVDACRNDPRLPGQRSGAKLSPREEAREFTRSLEQVPRGTVLLNSCTAGEVSYEDKELGHGVFMHYLLEGLGGAADADGNSRVSIQELSNYANQKTKTFVARQFNVTQRPFLKGDLALDVLDFTIAAASNPVPSRPPVTPPAPGENRKTFTNSIGMKLTLIPAGEFEMGNEEDGLSVLRRFPDVKPEDIADEYPLHKVQISRPFYLGVYEVTLGQFLKFYHDAGYQVECERDGKGGWGYQGFGKGFGQLPRFVPWSWGFEGQTIDHPVCNVTWNDAVAFCRWLSAKEGVEYRLPTEAEWEYACKAGTKTRYWFGNDPEEFPLYGNIADRTYRGLYKQPDPTSKVTIGSDDSHAFTAPVGSFQPNAFGLYDMHGNMSEWCSDWSDAKYYANSPAVDPQGAESGTKRVIRSGGWSDPPVSARSAFRGGFLPGHRNCLLGFRLARSQTR